MLQHRGREGEEEQKRELRIRKRLGREPGERDALGTKWRQKGWSALLNAAYKDQVKWGLLNVTTWDHTGTIIKQIGWSYSGPIMVWGRVGREQWACSFVHLLVKLELPPVGQVVSLALTVVIAKVFSLVLEEAIQLGNLAQIHNDGQENAISLHGIFFFAVTFTKWLH